LHSSRQNKHHRPARLSVGRALPNARGPGPRRAHTEMQGTPHGSAAILPLFLRRVQLPIPLGLNLPLMPDEHVVRRDGADRAVQTNIVVMLRPSGGNFQGIDRFTGLFLSMVASPQKPASVSPDKIIVAPQRPSVSTSGLPVIRPQSAASAEGPTPHRTSGTLVNPTDRRL
jgi:hypothetical protein